MQTSADYRSRRRHVSRMTDEKGETWSPSRMSKVRSKPILGSKTHLCKLHKIPNIMQIMWNYMKNHQHNSRIMFSGKEM